MKCVKLFAHHWCFSPVEADTTSKGSVWEELGILLFDLIDRTLGQTILIQLMLRT